MGQDNEKYPVKGTGRAECCQVGKGKGRSVGCEGAWDGLDLETNPVSALWGVGVTVCILLFFVFMVKQGDGPPPPPPPWVLWLPMRRGLGKREQLYSCNFNSNLRGRTWSRSWLLQSCRVDMLPVGLHVLTWGDAKRARARGRYLGSNLPFFLGHRFSSNWPLKRSIDSLRRSEYAGILKAKFPGTIKCIVLLCFIHLKSEVGKYSRGSEGAQTQRGMKCCAGIVDLNWLLLLSQWKDWSYMIYSVVREGDWWWSSSHDWQPILHAQFHIPLTFTYWYADIHILLQQNWKQYIE